MRRHGIQYKVSWFPCVCYILTLKLSWLHRPVLLLFVQETPGRGSGPSLPKDFFHHGRLQQQNQSQTLEINRIVAGDSADEMDGFHGNPMHSVGFMLFKGKMSPPLRCVGFIAWWGERWGRSRWRAKVFWKVSTRGLWLWTCLYWHRQKEQFEIILTVLYIIISIHLYDCMNIIRIR